MTNARATRLNLKTRSTLLAGLCLALWTPALAPAAVWSATDSPIDDAGLGFSATLPIANRPACFFRLRGN